MHCRLPKLELITLLITVENSNAQAEWQWKKKADITAILKVHTHPQPNVVINCATAPRFLTNICDHLSRVALPPVLSYQGDVHSWSDRSPTQHLMDCKNWAHLSKTAEHSIIESKRSSRVGGFEAGFTSSFVGRVEVEYSSFRYCWPCGWHHFALDCSGRLPSSEQSKGMQFLAHAPSSSKRSAERRGQRPQPRG
jgi:hypothetical protein